MSRQWIDGSIAIGALLYRSAMFLLDLFIIAIVFIFPNPSPVVVAIALFIGKYTATYLYSLKIADIQPEPSSTPSGPETSISPPTRLSPPHS